MKGHVGIIGAGAWGTAVAKVIAEKGIPVRIWSYEKETVEQINIDHENKAFLPGIPLPDLLEASTDPVYCADGAEFLILAAPSLYLVSTLKPLMKIPSIRDGETVIAVITKGFIPSVDGPRLIVETLEDHLPESYKNSLVYISGPSHAEEVSRGKITGLIAASENPKNSIRIRELLQSSRVLVFSSLDVRGVQVCAAAKNVIAIAFGMMDALKTTAAESVNSIFGDGTESLLLAAGLNEIQTLGHALGATHSETFTSIAGVGDLDVTCRSVFGRNRRFGRDIIEKKLLDRFQNLEDLISRIGEIGYLPEGAVACRYVRELIEQKSLRMPISIGIYKILNKEISPMDFLHGFVKDLR